MNITDELLTFCKTYQRIVIYGAGLYARILLSFLNDYGIFPEACVITGKTPGKAKLNGKVTISSFGDYDFGKIDDVAIIVSMQSIFHKDVEKEITNRFDKRLAYYLVSEDDQIDLETHYERNRFDRIIRANYELGEDELREYNKKIAFFKKSFKGVKIQLICMRSIGAAGVEWIRFVESPSPYPGYFNLFYPVSEFEDGMRGFNAYFLSKCRTEKGEVLCHENMKFWSYFFRNDSVFFSFEETSYSYAIRVKEINDFYIRHKFGNDKKYISFSNNEIYEGERSLSLMGVSGDFICFNARDSAYDREINKWQSDSKDLSSKYRNQNLENVRIAMEHLENFGIKAVRMGSVVDSRIEWNNTVDYASDFRSEFLDFYLMSKCKFFVSNMSGIQSIAHIFSKPLVVISNPFFTVRGDMPVFSDTGRDLLISRKFWSTEKRRHLFLSEILGYETNCSLHNFGSIGTEKLYERDRIIIEENTSEEIDAVVQEMVMREKGMAEYTTEDECMQNQFQHILQSFPMGSNIQTRFRIGRDFLRQNPWLLK